MKDCAIEAEQKDDLDILHLEGALDSYSFFALGDRA